MAVFARGTADGEAVIAVGRPTTSPDQIEREKIKEWYIQQLAGRSLRQIASKYGTSHMMVRRRIADIPESERDKLRRMYFGGAA